MTVQRTTGKNRNTFLPAPPERLGRGVPPSLGENGGFLTTRQRLAFCPNNQPLPLRVAFAANRSLHSAVSSEAVNHTRE